MPKRQRQFHTGAIYRVYGPAKRTRRLRFAGRAKIGGKEFLIFKTLGQAKKRRDSD